MHTVTLSSGSTMGNNLRHLSDEQLIEYLKSFAGERAAAKLQNRTFWNEYYYQ